VKQRLTVRLVKDLPRPQAGNRIYYDDLVSGFGCRVTAAGARAFVLNYRRRSDGVEHRYTIGSYPEWTVEGAREEAKTLRRSIDSGGDPVGDLRAQRDAPTLERRFCLLEHIAAKACLFLEQCREPECYLYRHYDPSGDLLYVGIS
jgi:Arm DNA-binding domain